MKRKWKMIVSLVLVLLFATYSGFYLHFRSSHTFIHRAGNYAWDSRLDLPINTNHYIEPGLIADGPQIFMHAAFTSGNPQDLIAEDGISAHLAEVTKAYHEAQPVSYTHLTLPTRS